MEQGGGATRGTVFDHVQRAGLFAGPVCAMLVYALFDFDPAQPTSVATAAVATLMAIWWMTEAIPLWATALLPIVLFPALGVSPGKVVAGHYINQIIFLFLGGFLVAIAMQKWNLHRRIALRILLFFGAKPAAITFGFMVATGFLSMWISNTATTMMMAPIVMALAIKLEESCGAESVRTYIAGLLLAVAYSASIGGVATLVGTPPNPAFVKIVSISFPDAPEISFAAWFAFGLPVALVFGLITWVYLSWMFRPTTPIVIDDAAFRREYNDLGMLSYEEKVVGTVFVSLAILWLTRADITLGSITIPGWSNLFPHPEYLTDGSVAIAMALTLFLIPSKAEQGSRILEWNAVEKLPWGIVLLFGGGFALAHGFKDSGLSAWFGGELSGIADYPPIIIVSIICLFSTFLTELTSNTATAQILLPILAELAVALKTHPLFIMIPATMAFSFAFMLPVATPPNAIVFGMGRLRISDMMKAGLALNFLGVVLITAAILLLGGPIFGIDPGTLPDWAG